MIWPFLIPITGIIALVVILIGLPIARAYARRLESSPNVPPDLALRLQHMEQSIDAIAIEVERIAEGQRFTTKLLAERTPDRAPNQSERASRTPEHMP